SQTLDNIYAEDEAATIKILRPLIGLDKSEIIEIAKKIKTYDISILPATSCTFTPKSPQTHAKLKEIKEAEKNIDIDKIINTAIESATITTI
ncbi:MAG: tRNA 4-thiouridine(8) synthase ThiI, partial [archaeon]|nr:tRNA 4-thiouridine(8) synthase ThiI [archaeon]